MRKLVSLLMVLGIATGCASQIMQGYVGKDVREVMLDYGPPANAFDMGDGRRAFQWVLESSYTTPTYVTTTGTVTGTTTGTAMGIAPGTATYTGNTATGYTAWVNTNTQIHGGQTITSKCFYTLFATWNEANNGWTVVGFRKPKFMCE
jgi:hypothetical protein